MQWFPTITAHFSDADGDAITYEWSQLEGPAVALSDAATDTVAFVAPAVADTAGVKLQLVVRDAELPFDLVKALLRRRVVTRLELLLDQRELRLELAHLTLQRGLARAEPGDAFDGEFVAHGP